jgi:hypothetical protein
MCQQVPPLPKREPTENKFQGASAVSSFRFQGTTEKTEKNGKTEKKVFFIR